MWTQVKDIYGKVYDIHNTIFNNQTAQLLTRSLSGHKYIMVMVELDNNDILNKPIKSRKDQELTQDYDALMFCLKHSNILPCMHVLDNKVSQAIKDHIHDNYKMELELFPPSCDCCNAPKVAICNLKTRFLSILTGAAKDSPNQLWDHLLPQGEITFNLL